MRDLLYRLSYPDVERLVVVVDADDSVVHVPAHNAAGYFHPQCRLCQLRAVFRQTVKKLPPARGWKHVLRGVGVAVPVIEAWYMCGRDDEVTEAQRFEGQSNDSVPFTRAQLKWRVYDTDRPNLPHEIRCALSEVTRLRTNLRRLENDFPGFEALALDLRALRQQRNNS